ncbi:MAG: hypothetical protein E3J71_05735 [Candidatus Stahlbacteria bacterium]|nr:MAG: hypothetical protein E3J71_05735 [Candidatus Stahlbacteria bacterium]
MKKLLLIATVALLAVGVTGVAVAASSPPTEMNVEPNSNNQILSSGWWSGTGDIWGTFTMGLTVDDVNWIGEWDNSEAGRNGTIEGTTSYVGDDYYSASGTWIETDPYGWQGPWSGTFYFPDPGDTCYGWILATAIPPGSGTFGGNLD